MKTRLFIYSFSALALLATTASAQVATPSLRSPLRPIPHNSGLTSWDCDLPPVPNAAPQRIATQPGNLVEWCVEGSTIAATRAALWMIDVDSTPKVPLAHACRNHPNGITEPIMCYAVLPADTITRLGTPGVHSLNLTTESIAGGLALTEQVERPFCMAFGSRYEVDAPLPNTPAAIAAGALYSTAGAFNVESLIGRLRKDGWQIEWLRTQWKQQPATAAAFALDPSGAFWLFGWCRGYPQ